MSGAISQVSGVFGSPAEFNIYAAMMDPAFDQLGLDLFFLNLEVSPLRLNDAVNGARAMGWLGLMFDDPHKHNVVTQLDGLAETAAVVGAATCAARRGDAFIGENTEGWAVVDSLEDHTNPDGARAMVLGAGLAGRAAAVELARAGVRHITIVNRSEIPARQVGNLLRGMPGLEVKLTPWQPIIKVPGAMDIIVNATPAGSELSDNGEIVFEGLNQRNLVVDLPFTTEPTSVVAQGKSAGATVVDGIDVLARQGALAIRLWTNAEADLRVMRAGLSEALGRVQAEQSTEPVDEPEGDSDLG